MVYNKKKMVAEPGLCLSGANMNARFLCDPQGEAQGRAE